MTNRILTTAVCGLAIGFLLGQISGCASARVAGTLPLSETRAPSSQSANQRELSSDSPTNTQEMIANGSSVQKPNEAFFQWPVDQARLSRGFLPKLRKPHWGIDLAAPKGTPILAAHDGVIIYTGREFRGFGKMVMIEGGRGWATLYAHFSKITAKEGQKVKKGDVIGEMGRTGHATGSHLHFEVRSDRGPVDPLDYLPDGARVAKSIAKNH